MADNRTLAKGAMIGGAPVYYTEESTTGTTMPNTSYFKTEDVDGKPVKISRDNIMGIVKECLGTILNGGSDQTTVTKVPTLNGNTLGASAIGTLASALGVNAFTYTADFSSSSYETNINCNAGTRGGTMIVLVSDHTASGDATYSAIFMLRCGYSGNNITSTLIAENGEGSTGAKTFSCSNDGNLVLNGRGKYLILHNF